MLCAPTRGGPHERGSPAQPVAGVAAARPRDRWDSRALGRAGGLRDGGRRALGRPGDHDGARDRSRRAARRREHLPPRRGEGAGALLVRRRQHPLRHPGGPAGARRSRSRCGCTTSRPARSAAPSSRCRTRWWRSGTAMRGVSTPATRRSRPAAAAARPLHPVRALRPRATPPAPPTCAVARGPAKTPAGRARARTAPTAAATPKRPHRRRHLPARRPGGRRERGRPVHDDLPGVERRPHDSPPLQGAPRPPDRPHHPAVLRRQRHGRDLPRRRAVQGAAPCATPATTSTRSMTTSGS